jgi:regulator of PEP synthase PpsR (kinase-PPPase family)
LIATADRISQVRQNRILGHALASPSPDYVDRASISEELAHTRKICARRNWPMIDVTRKSIEETAASVMNLRAEHLARYHAGGYDQ